MYISDVIPAGTTKLSSFAHSVSFRAKSFSNTPTFEPRYFPSSAVFKGPLKTGGDSKRDWGKLNPALEALFRALHQTIRRITNGVGLADIGDLLSSLNRRHCRTERDFVAEVNQILGSSKGAAVLRNPAVQADLVKLYQLYQPLLIYTRGQIDNSKHLIPTEQLTRIKMYQIIAKEFAPGGFLNKYEQSPLFKPFFTHLRHCAKLYEHFQQRADREEAIWEASMNERDILTPHNDGIRDTAWRNASRVRPESNWHV